MSDPVPVPITQLQESGINPNPLPAITDYIPIAIYNPNKLGVGVGGFQTYKIKLGNILSPLVGDIPHGAQFGVEFDGGGNPLDINQPGISFFCPAPFDATIAGVTMVADRVGTAVCDIRSCSFAAFDAGATHPVAADSICAGNFPALNGTKFNDVTLSGWDTEMVGGDVFQFLIKSVTNIIELTLTLQLTRLPGA